MSSEPRATVVLRSTFGQAIAVLVGLVVAVILGFSIPAPERAAALLGPLGVVAVAAWAAFYRPLVEVADGGVTVVNPWRTLHVPWPALASVRSRWALELECADGTVVRAFGAPGPGTTGRSRRNLAAEAREIIEQRREELAPYLRDPVPGGDVVTTRIHARTLVALGVLAAAWLVQALV